MMGQAKLVVVGTAVILGSVVGAFKMMDPNEDQDVSAGGSPRAARVLNQVGSGEETKEGLRRIRRLEEQVNLLGRRLAVSDSGEPEAPVETPQLTPEERRAKIQGLSEKEGAIREAKRSSLQAAHFADPVDPDWSATRSREVRTVFASQESENFSLDELDCRTSYCRAVVRQNGEDASEQELDQLLADSLLEGGGYTHPDEEGRTVVYSYRTGRYEEVSQVVNAAAVALLSARE